MLRKDYYLILGIPRGESAEGIRAAYRDLAKRHHPDLAGPSSAARFREITEAYEVLSDPARRHRYNHDLAEAETPPGPGPLRRQAEPVVVRPPSVFDRPQSVQSSFRELFEDFTGSGGRHAERGEGLNIQVVLTAEEASRGGVLPITLPVLRECPICQGTGEEWPFGCLQCHGQGLVERPETIRLKIPPGVRPASVFDVPLRGLGVHNFYLRVHIEIRGD